MLLLPRRPLHSLLHSNLLMSTTHLLPRCFSLLLPLRFPRRILVSTHPVPHASRPSPFSARFSAAATSSGTVDVVQKEDEAVKKRLVQLNEKLESVGINCGVCKPGQYSAMLCPKCEGGRSGERSFALFIREDGELAMWSCFRGKCGWKGHIQASSEGKGYSSPAGQSSGQTTKQSAKHKIYRTLTDKELELEPLCEQIILYFAERKISVETLRRNAVMQREVKGKIVIAFTYRRDGMLVNCKYRCIEKRFWQEKDAQKILYGVDDIKKVTDIIIVEGEIDKLSMEEAGYRNCVSVPDGAPAKVSQNKLPGEEKDTKYEYLWNCKDYLGQASRIILATDSDPPGQALAEELARRLGKERCWRVKWPTRNNVQVCKDANEVLMYLGPDALKQAIEKAEYFPIKGLFNFSDYFHEVDAYYHHSYGYQLGVSTGWRNVDKYYKVVPGELTVITGVPNSGKSEWIDSLMCNINRAHGWKFVLCSMENKVRDHARKLLEKHIQRPFFNASYGASVERMSVEELELGKEWLNDTFFLIRCEDDCLPSVNWVLSLAKVAVLRHGARGLVIDPYNELDHQRAPNQTETEYVSQMLSKIKRFAQHHACHVWFVAHPKQLQNWDGKAPNMYDISGSAHFINKCDNGIVIHRNRNKEHGPLDQVQVCVRKVRNKVAGSVGDAFLSYDRIVGEYTDVLPLKHLI